MTTNQTMKISVIGSGSFGTVLAHLLALKGHAVTLWGRNPEILNTIATTQTNPTYLGNTLLAPFKVTSDLQKAIEADVILFSIPSQFVRSIVTQIKNKLSPNTFIINTAKGIEQNTLLTMQKVFVTELGDCNNRYATLSGPTFAEELLNKNPSAAVLAGSNQEKIKKLQTDLSLPFFRIYTSDDVVGVELGGALKNVMAIATGVAEGLGFGLNTRAGLITRCLNEMTRLGVAMGANPLTFSGLSGVGDLILTCTGNLSRNRSVGFELGQGKTLEEILKTRKTVAEGVATTLSVYQLAQKYNVDMPNTQLVYQILYEKLPPRQALTNALKRRLKDESV